MEHWNGNQICAMDTETTGLDPFWHEIVQIAILPLDSNMEPRQDVLPFYINMIPQCPERVDREAVKVNKFVGCKESFQQTVFDQTFFAKSSWAESPAFSFFD